MDPVLTRFFNYVQINTQSDPSVSTCPSTPGQSVLAKLLAKELKSIGLRDVILDKNGYVTATLASNIKKDVPVVGFLAHMDTSPDFSGSKVNPQIHIYNGGRIQLDTDGLFFLDPESFPELDHLRGQTLITTDGRTLLGADDKAGLTEIMEAMKYLVDNPHIKHGTIKVGFTPDEEIGRGADLFPIEKFGADFAYTLDGGPVGELEYENFNAAGAKIEIKGRNVHPGTAKNKMINAMQVGVDFHASLPQNARPERTADYDGFYHLVSFKGNVENASLEYIIRDHNRQLFEEKKQFLVKIANQFNTQFSTETVKVQLVDQYFNMKEKIEPVFHTVETAREVMTDLGIKPLIKPIRGGTDGAKLSFMGLPTPNLFAGGYNFHGRYEFIPLESMKLAIEVIIGIAQKVTELNS